MGSPSRTSTRAALVLAALLAGLVVAGIVLGVVDARATARADDEAAAVAAVRARLEAGPAPGSTVGGGAVVVRAVGLESLDGDSARAFAAARLLDGTTPRAWRVAVGLTRQDGRWRVDDVADVP